MGKEKRSENEIKAIINIKETFIARFKERKEALNYKDNQAIANAMLSKYKEKIDNSCNKKFINHINKWCSNSEDNLSLPDFTNLYILSEVLDCDSDYLMGKQDKARKNIESFAKETGLVYEAVENLFSALKETFKNDSSTFKQMFTFILIRDRFCFIYLVCTLYAAFVNTDNYKKHHFKNKKYETHENREGLFYNISDFSRTSYHLTMNEIEHQITNRGDIQKLIEYGLEFWIYKYNYKLCTPATDPFENSSHEDNLDDEITLEKINHLLIKDHNKETAF